MRSSPSVGSPILLSDDPICFHLHTGPYLGLWLEFNLNSFSIWEHFHISAQPFDCLSAFFSHRNFFICFEFSALRDWIWTFQSCRCCIPPLKRIWTVFSSSVGFSELLIWALHNKVIYHIFSVAYFPIKKDQNGGRLNTFCQDNMLCWLYWAINLSFM